jgi:hypothetical protein
MMRRMKVWTSHATRWGRVRVDPPPPGASARGGAVVLVLAVIAGCSSSGGSAATPRPTAVRIPSPFEVGQQIGLGDVTLEVPSFRHAGGDLTVHVTATNGANTNVTIDPSRDFNLFYASRHWPGTVTAGSAAPIPPGGRASYTLSFRVPARYRYPLLWFDGPTSGSPATVVLRGVGT